MRQTGRRPVNGPSSGGVKSPPATAPHNSPARPPRGSQQVRSPWGLSPACSARRGRRMPSRRRRIPPAIVLPEALRGSPRNQSAEPNRRRHHPGRSQPRAQPRPPRSGQHRRHEQSPASPIAPRLRESRPQPQPGRHRRAQPISARPGHPSLPPAHLRRGRRRQLPPSRSVI